MTTKGNVQTSFTMKPDEHMRVLLVQKHMRQTLGVNINLPMMVKMLVKEYADKHKLFIRSKE